MSSLTQTFSTRWPRVIARSPQAKPRWKWACWPLHCCCRHTATSATGMPWNAPSWTNAGRWCWTAWAPNSPPSARARCATFVRGSWRTRGRGGRLRAAPPWAHGGGARPEGPGQPHRLPSATWDRAALRGAQRPGAGPSSLAEEASTPRSRGAHRVVGPAGTLHPCGSLRRGKNGLRNVQEVVMKEKPM
jgi:hypothetical protein